MVRLQEARTRGNEPGRSRPLRRTAAFCAPGLALALGFTSLARAEAPVELPADDAGAADEAPSARWSHDVSLLEEFRLRRASHTLTSPGPLGTAAAPENQLDQRLRLQADARTEGAHEHFLALLSGALFWDLDGEPEPGTANLYATQYDRSNPALIPYALSAEWRQAGALDHARLGRQDSEHGLPITFDGASLGVKPAGPKLLVYGFGGQTVHFFETAPGLFEQWVASVGALVRPSRSVRIDLDGRWLEERRDDSVEADRTPISTISYGVSAGARSGLISAKVRVRGIDEQVSHAGAALRFFEPSAELGIDAQLDTQLVVLGEVAESENPYFALLGPSLPHVRYRFEGFKALAVANGATWTNLLGWRGRQVVGYEEAPFNRNASAVYATSRFDDLAAPGLFVGVTAEWNYVPTARDEPWLLALGGSVGYGHRGLTTEVGTDYQRFKINYYQRAEELYNARTVFGAVGYRWVRWFELKGRYELEIVDRYLESFFLTARQDF